MPILYIVATPIGNLEDISLRALRVLREVKLIAAEDTRKTRRLLTAYDIKTPMTSYFEHNKLTKLDYILGQLKEANVALVSEAGMPGISDPGYELIAAASKQNIAIVPIPGPSAIITALAVSGLPTDSFKFTGFLPNKAAARRHALEAIANETGTIIVLEAPHRLTATLEDILKVLGDRRLAICREMTKLHEEIFRGRVGEAIKHFTTPRGEFTLVIEGKGTKEKPQLTDEVERQLHELYLGGASAKEAISTVAGETGLKRKELYQTWLKLDKVWERNRNNTRKIK
ncbi:MAG: 16S rRNA (cytidine(1402)-2'-O)-methyltransferase [Chloroflexi bacterium RBG_16_50_11]|nr:MAG: 16S rRNA (cytidine(1402)-2'-O)-methyltransferase [Chloroflexi bacterium RBG_16_50_11]